MKYKFILLYSITIVITASCSSKKMTKGFQVSSGVESSEEGKVDGLHRDSLVFETAPSEVLMTGANHIRLTSIFKVNYKKDGKSSFVGSNEFIREYDNTLNDEGNKWNNHIVPGFEAVYGYNFVNVSLNNLKLNKQSLFFEKPVLIKTLYYPSPEIDTLNSMPVSREYFMLTVYNEDTNKDGFINLNDLRRMYLFSLTGEFKKALIPENYSVYKSEYDKKNDFLYVFVQLDANGNGLRDKGETSHVFWIDLKNPEKSGRQY